MGKLQRRSFDLHAEQAHDLGSEVIDYRRMEAATVSCDDSSSSSSSKPKGKKLDGVEWADVNVVGGSILGGTDTIAQVRFISCDMTMGASMISHRNLLIFWQGKIIVQVILTTDNNYLFHLLLKSFRFIPKN